MFSLTSRETGYDGHDIEFRAIDSGGETIGSAYAAIDRGTLRLDIIQTNPPQRGKGIGKALMAAVIAWGRDRGASTIFGEFRPDAFSRPEEVEGFYAKHGVRVDPEENIEGEL